MSMIPSYTPKLPASDPWWETKVYQPAPAPKECWLVYKPNSEDGAAYVFLDAKEAMRVLATKPGWCVQSLPFGKVFYFTR